MGGVGRLARCPPVTSSPARTGGPSGRRQDRRNRWRAPAAACVLFGVLGGVAGGLAGAVGAPGAPLTASAWASTSSTTASTTSPTTPAASTSTSSTTSSTAPAAPSGLPGTLAYITDSNFYSTSGRVELVTQPAAGGPRHVLLTATSATIGLLSFSPDGQQIAYFYGKTSTASVDVMNLATKRVNVVFKLSGDDSFVVGLAWTPDGRDLVVGSNERPGSSSTHSETALWRVPLSGGSPTRLTGYIDAGSPTVAPDGDIVYVVSKTYSSASTFKKSTLWMADPDGSDARSIFTTEHFIATTALSPSGGTVALSVVDSETTSNIQAVTIGAPGSVALTPVVKGRSDLDPAWSPDGSHLAFLSSRAGRHAGSSKSDELLDAYVMTATGSDVAEAIGFTGDKASLELVSWGV